MTQVERRGSARNAPCWWGSGEKAKHCHDTPVTKTTRTLRADIKWGITRALGFALAASIWVAGIYSLDPQGWAEANANIGLNVGQIVLVYVVIAVIAGAFVGLLRPATKLRIGAFGVGACMGCLVYGAVSIAMGDPFWSMGKFGWIAILILGTVVGGTSGLISWYRHRRSNPRT